MANKYTESDGDYNDEVLARLLEGEFRTLPYRGKLDSNHLEYIVLLVLQQPNIYLWEIQERLNEDCQLDLSLGQIGRVFNGLHLSRKKLSLIHIRRFSPENLALRCSYLQFVITISPDRLFFFDEAGFNSLCGMRRYGRSFERRAYDAQHMSRTQNISLLALMGITGVIALNFVRGATNTFEVLHFFVDIAFDRIPDGSVIILDNHSSHHGFSEDLLRQLFRTKNCHLVFLPPYSPDLNPIENLFGTIKCLIKQDRVAYQQRPEETIMDAIVAINNSNAPRNWFRRDGYQ
eukprot:TRINITY_DN471_c0_g1_i2.p1 TRINITY_DN471_c0_g1~~TRINITY_DN471_c0_g1_i2.p1  ORF type:complete len:290 (+),score=46.42 TRINITY_DN471_c0_g1_i2:381-1250(+)